jgi:hypothetical protein
VPADDLSSIPGLEDKHRRVLARRQITTFRALAHSDRRVIHKAMASIRPRPTLELIARWQDDARSKRSEAVLDSSDWHTTASFAVVFAQRQAQGAWQRRLEIERTEVEPERDPETWPGWDCSRACGWMLGQLGEPGEPGFAGPAQQTAGVPADSPVPAVLRIDWATLVDAASRTDVAAAGLLAENPPAGLIAPVRIVLKVSGAPPGHQVQAVVRFRRRGQQGWNPREPVTVPRSGQAEFDLSRVPAGQYQLTLLAWTPDASAKLASISLPAVAFSPPAS